MGRLARDKDSKNRVKKIILLLRREYPAPKTVLNYRSPFEMLVATMLSAQTTDVHVNKVTSHLFKKYRTVEDYADASLDQLRNDIKSINFFNNKAKNIQSSARMILDKFKGKIPMGMDELVLLPGVARKTANIVLANVYGISEGIAVDTHVRRLSNRLGITTHHDPVKIEKDLMVVTVKAEWRNISNLLILHGRKVCKARKPEHDVCVLRNICPSKDL